MKTMKKIGALLLALIILCTALLSLSSCGNKNKINYNRTESDENVINYISRLLNYEADAYEKFVAAKNGYNMSAEVFDDSRLEEMDRTEGINFAGVDAVLDLLASKVPEAQSKNDILAKKQGAAEGTAMTEAEVDTIINDHKYEVSLERDGGLWKSIMFGIGWFLNLMTSWFGGYYAISIFFFALLIKVVFLPFSIKQQKTQIKTAKLTPQIELIKAKYKGRTDQVTMRKMQEEIMTLQQQEGASPLSGCLPLLIQFPIIIALYNIVTDPLRYVLGKSSALSAALNSYVTTARAAGGLGMELGSKSSSTIQLLSMAQGKLDGLKDFLFLKNPNECFNALNGASALNFNLFGVSLADTPSFKNFSVLVLIPFIAALAQWLTMFLTKKWNGNANQINQNAQTDMSMKMMDLIFPAMTLWMAFSFSGMLGLYWIYQSILAILQTYLLCKFMPMPKFTEEELKAMRKAQKDAEKQQRIIAKEQPKYKSLHYIDEDDYDELPDLQNNDAQNNKKSNGNFDLPEIKD